MRTVHAPELYYGESTTQQKEPSMSTLRKGTQIHKLIEGILEGREDAVGMALDIQKALARKLSDAEFVHHPLDAVPWLRAAIGNNEEESFAAVFLDQGRRVLGRHIFAEGSRTRTVLYPRQLFKKALELNATGVILSHNHPGGATSPSGADRNLTHAIAKTGEALEVELVDHIIITRESNFSFREAGLL